MTITKIGKPEGVKMVSHAGNGMECQNTAAGFIAAGNHSYFGIETDLRFTGDGHFVCHHNNELYTPDGKLILIEESDLETVCSVPISYGQDRARRDMRVPTLEDYLEICKRYGKVCVLELKSKFSKPQVEAVIEIIRQYDYLDRIIYISFYEECLDFVREILPDAEVQMLLSEVDKQTAEHFAAKKMDIDMLVWNTNKIIVDYCHSLGIKVGCWTCDTVELAQIPLNAGCDFITTNTLE